MYCDATSKLTSTIYSIEYYFNRKHKQEKCEALQQKSQPLAQVLRVNTGSKDITVQLKRHPSNDILIEQFGLTPSAPAKHAVQPIAHVTASAKSSCRLSLSAAFHFSPAIPRTNFIFPIFPKASAY